MKYPCLGDMQGFNEMGEIKSLFSMIKRCVHEVHEGEQIYHRIDMSDTELDDFIDSMSTENFESVGNFFQTMPKLKHVVEIENPKTKVKNEMVIEGLQSFFE
jgi:signal recognition particle GTPase